MASGQGIPSEREGKAVSGYSNASNTLKFLSKWVRDRGLEDLVELSGGGGVEGLDPLKRREKDRDLLGSDEFGVEMRTSWAVSLGGGAGVEGWVAAPR